MGAGERVRSPAASVFVFPPSTDGRTDALNAAFAGEWPALTASVQASCFHVYLSIASTPVKAAL